MKWVLRLKYFTANTVKLIHILIHPKPKKEQKYSPAEWELRHINLCRLITQALTALKLDKIVARKLFYLFEKTGRDYLDVCNIQRPMNTCLK